MDKKILELANIFDREYFINKLAEEKDVLENLHANTHLPMILSAMHRYNISGEEKYRTVAVNFYNYLLGRTFANGNNSSKATAYIKGGVSEKSEHWGGYGKLDDALTGGESESCCAHNTEKILEHLYKWLGSVEFLEHIEILKYNAVLNSASSITGLSQYHQPMSTGAVKKFSGAYDTFWCCTASGVEAMSEVQKNIWLKEEDAILLNMFIASTVQWSEKNAIITQQTHYPDSLISTITINVQKPTAFKLILKESAVKTVKVNDRKIELNIENDYIVIERIFNDNDKIEIEINASLQLVPLKGSQEVSAIMYGKVLLAQLGESQYIGDITNENINKKLIRSKDKELSFMFCNSAGKVIEFKPLYRVENEVYSVYMNIDSNCSHNNSFSFAKDGSSAYKE